MNIFTLIFLCSIVKTQAYKFLFLFPTASPSHVIQGRELALELVHRGHHVDFVSPFALKEKVTNYTDVFLEGLVETIQGQFQLKVGEKIDFWFYIKAWWKILTNDDFQLSNLLLNNTNFQPLLSNRNKMYDGIVLELTYADALTQLGWHFQAPLIGFSPLTANSVSDLAIGNPTLTSISPSYLLPLTDQMNFYERIVNTVVTWLSKSVYDQLNYFPQSRIRNKFFPSNYPPLEETRRNFSIVLTNSDPIFAFSRPLVPGCIDISGFHVKPSKDLPGDLKEILDGAKKGAIFFSMGSNLNSKDLSSERLKVFLDAFKQLDQIVLWKWEDEAMKNQPENVVVRKWFPQTDVLAHVNVKLFITHGGLGSVMEAFTRAVPMVFFPIFGDQPVNALRGEREGYGKSLDIKEVTTDTLVNVIHEVLVNETYTIKIKERQRMLLEKPIKPLDNAMFWMEYVAKYGGAPQLRSRILDLNFFQLYLLDVTGFLIGCLIVALIIGYYCLKLTKKILCKMIGMVKSKRKEKKKNQ